jgi:tetratricopeptide (TPR) repeat protein
VDPEDDRRIPDTLLRDRLSRLTKSSVIEWLLERSRLDAALRQDLTQLALPAHVPPASPDRAGEPIRIARRMLEGGRPADALEHLDRLEESDPRSQAIDELPALRSEALLALGRPTEAFEVLWSAFRRTLRVAFLRSAIALAPRGRAAHIDSDAMDAAEAHPDADLALGFLIARGALDRAAGLIERRFGELSVSARTGLRPVATALREEDPRQSWQLLRLMLIDVLDAGDARTYARAREHLKQMGLLAQSGGFRAEHEAFVEQLRQDYRRKTAFWRAASAE